MSKTSAPRVFVLDHDTPQEIFEVITIENGVARVRSPYLFEIGEELLVRIEHDGTVCEAIARVCAHLGPKDALITELEISEQSAPRPVVSE